MRKIHWERSPEDVEEVYFLVNKLKCFDNYPEHVKREISKVLYYDVYEDGRILFKQGHPGMSFYFILSGGVTIIREELDTVTHQTHQQVVDEKAAGDTFGEIALLQNTTRTSTVICKGDSEFFRVDRPDFDQVLRKSHQLDREETLNCLSTQKMFQEWNLEQLKFANAYTKLVSFPPNTVIFNDLKESPEFVHLILSGQCKVVREVTMVKTVFPFGQTRLTLAPLDAVSSTKLEKNQYLDSHFFVVCILQTGQYFGVGEDLCKTCILSGGNKVTCLLVNRIVFNRPENKHFLETMKTHLTETVPSRLAAYKCFLADRRWKVYKKKLIDDLVKKRKLPLNTRFEDVPSSLRSEEGKYVDFYR